MSTKLNDPLLAIARAVIIILQAIMAIAAAALLIGLPLVLFLRDRITAELRAELGDAAAQLSLLPILGLLMLALAVVALVWLVLRNLRRIVDTVGDGDPFVPANAERLTGMAWMMLAIQGLAALAGALGIYIGTVLNEPVIEASFNIDLSGIVLVVVLFILARVFRQGAAMREDLEGTV